MNKLITNNSRESIIKYSDDRLTIQAYFGTKPLDLSPDLLSLTKLSLSI